MTDERVSASETFYRDLNTFSDARGVSELSNYIDVPETWHVVLADVKGSTRAIQEGRYKDVNMVGAAAIAAVCNAWDRRYLPYVFGGGWRHFSRADRATLTCDRHVAIRGRNVGT